MSTSFSLARCVTHEMQRCDYCADRYESAREKLTAAMAWIHPSVPVSAQRDAGRVVPVPSTDDFPADYAADFRSRELGTPRQVPRVNYPHWVITHEDEIHYNYFIRHYETDTYGETTYKGLVRNMH